MRRAAVIGGIGAAAVIGGAVAIWAWRGRHAGEPVDTTTIVGLLAEPRTSATTARTSAA